MKWLKIIGVAVFLFVVAAIAIVSTQGYRMEREIDSKIAAIKANGDPVCGKDLFPSVADAKNGAPLYERVLAMVEPDKDFIDNASSVSSSCRLKENPELLVSARQMAAKYKSIVPLIEQASAYPQFRFKTNWNDPPEEILFPYYSKLRRLSRLLSEIAIVDAMDGKTSDSIRAIKSGYSVSASIKKEPILIGSLFVVQA